MVLLRLPTWLCCVSVDFFADPVVCFEGDIDTDRLELLDRIDLLDLCEVLDPCLRKL